MEQANIVIAQTNQDTLDCLKKIIGDAPKNNVYFTSEPSDVLDRL